MQRSVVDDSSAPSAVGSRSVQLAPTALDRMLDRAQRAAPQLAGVSDLLLMGVAVLLTLVDVAVWATDPEVETGRLSISIAILVPCLGALANIALALRRRRRPCGPYRVAL